MPSMCWNILQIAGCSMPDYRSRALFEVENSRYSAVRAAGWLFDHDTGVWRHEPSGRTGLNQHVIHECLGNHDALPPCGQTRADTPYADRRQWIDRAARLREIEVGTSLRPQIRATQNPTGWINPWPGLAARERAPPQTSRGKQHRVMDPLWEA